VNLTFSLFKARFPLPLSETFPFLPDRYPPPPPLRSGAFFLSACSSSEVLYFRERQAPVLEIPPFGAAAFAASLTSPRPGKGPPHILSGLNVQSPDEGFFPLLRYWIPLLSGVDTCAEGHIHLHHPERVLFSKLRWKPVPPPWTAPAVRTIGHALNNRAFSFPYYFPQGTYKP